MAHCRPSLLSLPSTGLPSSLTMLTAPSTPSSALTVTGDVDADPDVPVLHRRSQLGEEQVAERRALIGDDLGRRRRGLLLHADSPSTTAGMSAMAVSHRRLRRGPATDLTCHIVCSTSRSRTNPGNSLGAPADGGATTASLSSGGRVAISPCAAGPVIVSHAAPLAQLVEQLTLNQRVRGSKP